jgi:hypothetical protein
MTTKTQSRTARRLARLRRYWAELEHAQPEIRNPRVPDVTGQRRSSRHHDAR